MKIAKNKSKRAKNNQSSEELINDHACSDTMLRCVILERGEIRGNERNREKPLHFSY